MEQSDLALSIVISGRNDNWMGTFDTVTPYVCRRNCELLSRFTASFELIFVEWAPLEDRSPLSCALADCDPRIRCLIVPRAIHDGFQPKIGFLQYHARNVGIRRARGRIVLATNADIILSPGVVQALLGLDDRTLLRAPRRDVSRNVLNCKSIDEVIAFSERPENHVFTHVLHRPQPGGADGPYLTNAAGDFVGMHKSAWLRCRGFHQRVDASLGVDAQMIHQAEALRIRLQRIDWPIYHIDHEEYQPGRMSFPPYSRVGYENPLDWGLGEIPFAEVQPRIARCSADWAGSFSLVHYEPGTPIGIEDDSLDEGLSLDLVDTRLFRHQVLVGCGVGVSDIRMLAKGRLHRVAPTFVWRPEDASDTGSQAFPYVWKQAPRKTDGVLYFVTPQSQALKLLEDSRAEEGRHYVICEKERTTLSFLRYFLRRFYSDLKELTLFGFGQNGRHIAEKLLARPAFSALEINVYDDSAAACASAKMLGLRTLSANEFAAIHPRRLVMITPTVPRIRNALVRKLAKLGWVEGKHYWMDFRRQACDPNFRRPPLDRWVQQETADGKIWRQDPHLATLVHSGEVAESDLATGTIDKPVSCSRQRTIFWNQHAFPQIDDWQDRAPERQDEEIAWVGILEPAQLAARQVLAVCRDLLPAGYARLKRGVHASEFRRALRRSISGRSRECSPRRIARAVTLAHAAAENAEGTIVHAGKSDDDVTQWLMLGAIAGGFGKTIHSIALGNHGWDESDRAIRGFSARRACRRTAVPFRVARMYEHPAAAAVMLRHHPVQLLVFSDVEGSFWLREAFLSLSPLLVDGGMALFIAAEGAKKAFEHFVERCLRNDRRFAPVVGSSDSLLLRRTKLPEAIE